MDKRIIIGCGTGRCGTVSFCNLLKKQGIDSTHESVLLPWKFDRVRFDIMMASLLKRDTDIVADTAFYFLPYTESIIKQFSDTKFVCLKRGMGDTVRSYMKKTVGRNHWCNDSHSRADARWDICYPTYPAIRDKRTAVCQYWKEYYNYAGLLARRFPDNFKVFRHDKVLNTEKGQIELFEWLEIDNYQTHLDIVMNTSNK